MQLPVVTAVASVTAVITSIHTAVVVNRNVITVDPLAYVASCYAPSPIPTRIKEQGQLAYTLAHSLWSVDSAYQHSAMATSAISAIMAAAVKDPNSAKILNQISLGQRALTDFQNDEWYRKAVPTDVQLFVAVYHNDREAEAEHAIGHPANLICENQWTRQENYSPWTEGPKGYQYGC